jgi:hypothetical protein
MEDKPVITWGQDVAGASFNPSNNPEVAQSKQQFADLLDYHHNAYEALAGSAVTKRVEMAMHRHEMVIDNLILTQMLSTKAITYKV